MTEIPTVAIGAIAAALITGLVSLLGLIISKEQKVSDFRQAWIDSLRSEISDLISHANAIHGAASASFKNSDETWKVVREDFLGINRAAANIRLRLNPEEESSKAVLTIIEELEKHLSPGIAINCNALNETEKRLVSAAQTLLKKEWVRVRSGERVYRVARVVSLIVLTAGILILGFAAFGGAVGQ